ncbi:MAG: hypothetical protein AAB316_07410, partial [Bacteroidota bacterium]
QALSSATRLWIYQSNRSFSEAETAALRNTAARFAENWVSHNRSLRAYGDLLLNRFIVLLVDESQADASGCSIDKSVYFLKQVEREFGVDLFDRMNFAWLPSTRDEVRTANRDDFSRLYQTGEITNETLVFDNLVQTKADFEKSWLKPLGKSWHKRIL